MPRRKAGEPAKPRGRRPQSPEGPKIKQTIALTPSVHAKLLALGDGVLSVGVERAAGQVPNPEPNAS